MLLVAHDESDVAEERGLAAEGDVVGDGDGADGGVDEAGEHFEGGGFSGTVGAEEADDFAGVDGEGERFDGVDGAIFSVEEMTQGVDESGLAGGDAEGFGEV